MTRIHDDRSRVLVVTADEETASFIRQTLQQTGEFVWSGWATDAGAARALAADVAADVIVTDVFVPGAGGGAIVAALVAEAPDLPVLALTHRPDAAPLLDAVRAGAAGYVRYGDGHAQLAEALRAAVRGRLYFSDSALVTLTSELGRTAAPLTARVPATRSVVETASLQAAATLTDVETPIPADDVVGELTPRERQVVDRLALGLDNRTIGRQLGISDGTVATYVKRIRDKLGATTRIDLMTMSARLGSLPAATDVGTRLAVG